MKGLTINRSGKKSVYMIAALLLAIVMFAFCGQRVHAANPAEYAPVFNAGYYADHYADVKAAYGYDTGLLLDHFIAYGMSEGRQASEEFNVYAYRARYADLNNAFGNDLKQYYIHYLHLGKREARIATGDGTVPPATPTAVQTPAASGGNGQPITDGSNWQSIPGTSDPSYAKAAEILSSLNWDINKAFNWSAGLTYYGHGKKDMPEVADPGTNWFANYGYDNRKGNCFVMAATFFQFARLCGYAPRQMVGMVPSRKGGLTIHSWVEIDVDGKTYVYDPDFQMNRGTSGFKLQYGQKGTWRYTDYRQMGE